MAHQTSASAEAWPAADCRCLDIRRHVARAPFFASQRLLSRGLDPPKCSTPKDAPLSKHMDTGGCHGRSLGGACRSTAVSSTSSGHAWHAMGAPCNARRHCWRAILQKRHGRIYRSTGGCSEPSKGPTRYHRSRPDRGQKSFDDSHTRRQPLGAGPAGRARGRDAVDGLESTSRQGLSPVQNQRAEAAVATIKQPPSQSAKIPVLLLRALAHHRAGFFFPVSHRRLPATHPQ